MAVTINGSGDLIVQAVSETRTDVFSESLTAGSKSGAALTKAITTSAASNKVLVSLYLTTSVGGTSNRFGVTLKRGGSEIAISDSTGDNKKRTSVCGNNTNDNNCDAISFSYLDSPGSAASHTYTVHLNHGSSNTQTIYLNRAGVESNNNYRMRGTSTLTLQEISG